MAKQITQPLAIIRQPPFHKNPGMLISEELGALIKVGMCMGKIGRDTSAGRPMIQLPCSPSISYMLRALPVCFNNSSKN